MTRTAIEAEGLDWYEGLPASPAVRAGDLLFVSGQLSADAARRPLDAGDVRAQAARALDRLRAVLEAAGGDMDDVADVISFHTDVRQVPAVLEVAAGYFGDDPPAWTPVASTGSYSEGLDVSIRAIAHLGDAPKRSVGPEAAGWPEGLPVSAACRCGEYVFVAGQAATAATGEVESRGDHAAQARSAYEHVGRILESAGASMDDVLDICSFHLDPRGMAPCERVHLDTWRDTPIANAPAWTAIGVPGMWLPGALAQYRVIADLSPGARVAKTPASIHWKNTPNSGGSRKEGGALIGIAGEVASDAEGNVTTPGDTFRQARYCFNRIREVVEMHGGSMGDVVEITSFHKDHRDWEIVMEAGREYFDGDNPPAWTPTGATGLWNPGYQHEIYALAVVEGA
jgi:enamine deaminase RidA (YjgF/YER057c/UK114 family)